jgi:ATP-dependent DNA helicase RecG
MARAATHARSGTISLDMSAQYVKGIGPRRFELLAAHGIHTIADLIDYAPMRYEDRTRFRPIQGLRDGEWSLLRARVCSIGFFEARTRRMSIVEALVKDQSGALPLKFFNQPYLRRTLAAGQNLIIYGQARHDEYSRGSLVMTNPEVEVVEDDGESSVHSGRVVPIYRRIAELRPRTLRQILHTVIENLPGDLPDTLPEYLRKQLRLMARREAIAQIHFPLLNGTADEERKGEMEALNSGLSPAHKRFIFEELFHFQVGIRTVRERRIRVTKARSIQLGDNVRQAIKRVLPFHPTAAQKRVLREIADDMRSIRPMSRLLQGDVGSGKTIVAAQAAIIAVENGYQVAIMAPTEILAEQHYFNFRRLLSPLNYTVDLVKGSLTAKRKREALDRIRSGESEIAIGTHALIQEGVGFQNLALAVIDEQHRFGVMQRNVLREKGLHPDVLVMTATPIPRSLALTLYGDLDVSVIDELPAGRKPILTTWCREKDRAKICDEIRQTVADGHQVYVVYPLVEESEKQDLRAATESAELLQTKIFPDLRIGLLHGQMKSSQKEEVMSAFASRKLDILASTTVVEVGVDVGNATLMIIEHAERFGLAQLHQLRGRVGRGADQSACILIGDVRNNPDARRRLEVMCETTDGFRIAEVDLELRGPGEIAGTRQSGVPSFKYANLVRDRKALELARVEADRFLKKLRVHPDEELKQVIADVRQRWQDRYGLALVG